jgi:hypothetical protein
MNYTKLASIAFAVLIVTGLQAQPLVNLGLVGIGRLSADSPQLVGNELVVFQAVTEATRWFRLRR